MPVVDLLDAGRAVERRAARLEDRRLTGVARSSATSVTRDSERRSDDVKTRANQDDTASTASTGSSRSRRSPSTHERSGRGRDRGSSLVVDLGRRGANLR